MLRTLNTNGINLSIPDFNGASGQALASIAVADDGTIYAANETADAGGFGDPTGTFTIYRWNNSDAPTTTHKVVSAATAASTALPPRRKTSSAAASLSA